MPKIDLTPEEQVHLEMALTTEIKSIIRAKNNAKSPQFAELYRQSEHYLTQLRAKITAAK